MESRNEEIQSVASSAPNMAARRKECKLHVSLAVFWKPDLSASAYSYRKQNTKSKHRSYTLTLT